MPEKIGLWCWNR